MPCPTNRSSPHANQFPWLTLLFLVVVFFCVNHDVFYSKLVVDSFNASEEAIITGVNEGSLARRIALLALGLFAVISLYRHPGSTRHRINGPLGWIVLSFAAWALMSVVWAEDLALTFRRLVVFAILCTAAEAVARRLSPRHVIFCAFFGTSFFLSIGVLAEVLLGTFKPLESGYRFAGTLHPNLQGVNCAFLLLSGVAAADVEKRWRKLFCTCAFVGTIFLFLTASRTALAAACLAVVAYFAAVSSRVTKIAVTCALIIGCGLLLLPGAAFFQEFKTAMMLGKNVSDITSFNGRRGIWEDCAYYIAKRPITGYGFGGFWNEAHIAEISTDNNWGVGGAHSAYLDCLLQLGAIGIIAYFLALVMAVGYAFRLYGVSRNAAFAFFEVLLLFALLDGLLESIIITPTFFMFLCVVAIIQLASEPPPRSPTPRFVHNIQ